MRRRFAAVLVAAGLLALTAAPAAGITKNWVADFDHPFVGLIVFYDEEGEFSHRCSGSLLTPTIFLTAGHCTDDGEGGVMPSARVWFQQDAGAHFDPVTELDAVTGYPEFCAAGTLGTVCATSDTMYNFGFDNFAGFPNIHDVGVVVLDQKIEVSEYGELPDVGVLNALLAARGLQDTNFLASGYGVTYRDPVHFVSFRSRLQAVGQLVNLNSINNAGFNLQTQGNGTGQGGTCGGDSGGPVFYPTDSNVIVAVTSFGLNPWCRGVDFAYRLDRQPVIDFILEKAGAEAGSIVVGGETGVTASGDAWVDAEPGTDAAAATTPGNSGERFPTGTATTPAAVPQDPSADRSRAPEENGPSDPGSQGSTVSNR
jgi:hypothetical protein